MEVTTRPLVSVCLLFFFVVSHHAVPLMGEELMLNDKEIYRFALHLYQRGEYYRAISEWKRLEFFFPNSELFGDSILQIGRAYMAGGNNRDSISHWGRWVNSGKVDLAHRNRMRILRGISRLDLGRGGPFSLRESSINRAISEFVDLRNQRYRGEYSEQLNGFVSDWQSREALPKKSPWIAGALSATVPGSGSVYAGRYVEGTYAFFMTSLFYFATMDAIRSDQRGLGYVFGFFTLAFYGGNIYTSVNGVYKVNDKRSADQLVGIRREHGIWFVPERPGRAGRF